MRTRNVLILILITALLSTSLTYVLAQTPTSTMWISPGVYPGATTYTIWNEGANFFAKTDLGQIAFSGTVLAVVTQACHDAFGVYGGHIHFSDMYAEMGQLNVTSQNVTISGNGYSTTLFCDNGTNAMFYVSARYFNLYNIHLIGINSTGGRSYNSHGVILTSAADYPNIHDTMINQFDQSAIEQQTGCNVAWIHDNYLSCYGTSTSTQVALLLGSVADSIYTGNQIGGGYYAVSTSSAAYLVFTGNKIFGANHSHIKTQAGRSLWDGNIIGGGLPYPTAYSFWLTASSPTYGCENIISNNRFYSVQCTQGIRLQGSTVMNNTIIGNNFETYGIGIRENDGTENWNLAVGNVFNNVTTPISFQGLNSSALANSGPGVADYP